MLSKSRAIVLKATKYSDNSLIIKFYTEQHGLKTYLVGGVHGKKSKVALFMPLSLLEIVANHKEKNKLIRPKEIAVMEPLQNVHSDIRKSSVLLFLNEVIYKSIKEEEPNTELFNFLFNSILQLENNASTISNFHIDFLLKFSKYLGFYPQDEYSNSNCFFNLKEGTFEDEKTKDSLDEKTSELLYNCITESFDLISNKEMRKNLLDKIMLFYSFHVHGFGNIKSLDVLHEINL